MFLEVFYSLRKNHDLIEYEKDRFLSFGFLEKKGYQKEDIREYTDRVYERMDDSFFTRKNIKEKNIQSRLDALKLEDIFYEDLLKNDERFSYCIIHHQTVFKKDHVPFTRKTFLSSVLSSFDSIDYADLDSHLQNRYGLRIPKCRIDEYILSSDIYYDTVSQRYYRDYETYLSKREKRKKKSILNHLV